MKEDDLKGIQPSGKPMISSRLPKAFSQPKHLTHKKNHEHQDISAANEFKKLKKLLSPLKNPSPSSSAFRKVIKKLAHFPKMIDQSASNIHMEMLVQSPIKLEEMITISLLKSFCSSGTVRKSLHAPTFKLYATKEIPINTLSARKKLVETLKSWQKVQKQARYLIEISSSFWNSPEGCVTLVMEYMPGDSLSKLCDCIGAVPEKLLRTISKRVLAALSYFHQKIGGHGSVNMSHIMFDREGNCKLGIGLAARLNNKDENSSANIDILADVYSFGSCMLTASLGTVEWISEVPQGSCCLYHDCLRVPGVPYVQRFTESFKDFLCKATRYEGRAGVNELISHPWISNEEIIGADINVKELLGMSFVGSKESNLNVNVEKQINLLMESLQVVLTGKNEAKTISSTALKELSLELGVSPQLLHNKILTLAKDT